MKQMPMINQALIDVGTVDGSWGSVSMTGQMHSGLHYRPVCSFAWRTCRCMIDVRIRSHLDRSSHVPMARPPPHWIPLPSRSSTLHRRGSTLFELGGGGMDPVPPVLQRVVYGWEGRLRLGRRSRHLPSSAHSQPR